MVARRPWRTIAACFVVGVLGGAASLLTAGPALFADGPFAERPPVLAVSVVIFFLLGAAVSYANPSSWKPVAITLAIVGVPVVAFFGPDTFGQAPMMLLSAGFVLGDAAGGVFGAWAGARLSSARRSHTH